MDLPAFYVRGFVSSVLLLRLATGPPCQDKEGPSVHTVTFFILGGHKAQRIAHCEQWGNVR